MLLSTITVLVVLLIWILAQCKKYDEYGVVGYVLKNSSNEVLMEERIHNNQIWYVPKIFKNRKAANEYLLDNRVKYYVTALLKREFDELKTRSYQSYGKIK
jgi:hypothetical protein